MIKQIHHVQLAMPRGREKDAEAFYSGVLGLKRISKPAHLEVRGGCWFSVDDGLQFHLGVEHPFSPARKAHPAFLVEDIKVVRDALEASGYDIVVDTQLQGFERFYTFDPFGNRLELVCPVRPI